jgi:hypothetical protein
MSTNLNSDQQKLKKEERKRLIDNIVSIFLCSECMIPLDSSSLQLSNNTTHPDITAYTPPIRPPNRHNGPHACCCMSAAVLESIPAVIPTSIVPHISSFLHNSPTRSFLTSAIQPEQGQLQCHVIWRGTQYECWFEISKEYQDVKHWLAFGEENSEYQHPLTQRNDSNDIIPDNLPASLPKHHFNAIRRNLDSMARQMILKGDDILLMTARKLFGEYEIFSADNKDEMLGSLESESNSPNHFILSDNGEIKPTDGHVQVQKQLTTTSGIAELFSSHFSLPSRFTRPSATMISSVANLPHVRHELCKIYFDHYFKSSLGSPVRLNVLIPNSHFDLDREALVYGSIKTQYDRLLKTQELKKKHTEDDDLFSSLSKMTDIADSKDCNNSPLSSIPCINYIQNQQPKWSEENGSYMLRFDNSRIKQQSVKNMKLVRNYLGKPVTVLQFGRVNLARNKFILGLYTHIFIFAPSHEIIADSSFLVFVLCFQILAILFHPFKHSALHCPY